MESNHIITWKLQELLARFRDMFPYGSTSELARFMFNKGYEAGRNENAPCIYE